MKIVDVRVSNCYLKIIMSRLYFTSLENDVYNIILIVQMQLFWIKT